MWSLSRSSVAIFVLSFVSIGTLGYAQAPSPSSRPLRAGNATSVPAAAAGWVGPRAGSLRLCSILKTALSPLRVRQDRPRHFSDISEKAGLTKWNTRWAPRRSHTFWRRSFRGRFARLRSRRWLDIYIVNGSTYDALDGKAEPPHAALFHNNHDGTFTDVAAKAGVTNDRWDSGRCGRL